MPDEPKGLDSITVRPARDPGDFGPVADIFRSRSPLLVRTGPTALEQFREADARRKAEKQADRDSMDRLAKAIEESTRVTNLHITALDNNTKAIVESWRRWDEAESEGDEWKVDTDVG